MNKEPITVAVTGAAGNIAYSLLFRLAAGNPFGDRKINLNLIEIEPVLPKLEGVCMELNDCAFRRLNKLNMTSNINKGFDGVNYAFLVGSVPRKAGMERSDLLGINGKIFVEQGHSLNENAADDVRMFVVGNPCNTNALIGMKNSPDIPSDRWMAMTFLDQSRAKSQLAKKSRQQSSEVTRMAVWGNHSPTQYPDFTNALIGGKPVIDVIKDRNWLKSEFINKVQKRGTEIIHARGSSSAASAASAALDNVRATLKKTRDGDCFSAGIYTGCREDIYDIDKNIVCSMPLSCDGENWEIVDDFKVSSYSRGKIDNSVKELQAERSMVKHLFPK